MPGLYVHIPFCVRKCRYCDFFSLAQPERMERYLSALYQEAHMLARHDWGTFDTVFFGGGTPSLLSGAQAQALLHELKQCFAIAPDAEISFECNPGTLDKEKLHAYRNAGINRLSIGVQSLDNGLLQRIGRIHTKDAFFESFRLSREAGFQNINVDVMHGLPGQRKEDYLHTLSEVVSLSPAHISAYGLILEEGTALFDDVAAKRETLPDEDDVYEMQDAGIAYLEQQGYSRYEVSNFAKPGYACRHNIGYWANGPYLGIGASAHSAWRLNVGGTPQWTRWNNPADLDLYLKEATAPLLERTLTPIPYEEEAFETVMVGLRTIAGISLADFEARFEKRFKDFYPHTVAALLKKGWLIISPTHAYLTKAGLDMQNAALQHFLDE